MLVDVVCLRYGGVRPPHPHSRSIRVAYLLDSGIQMDVKVWAGIAIALLAGLGTVALKHPRFFRRRLASLLVYSGAVVSAVAMVWLLAVLATRTALLPLIGALEVDEAKALTEPLTEPVLYIVGAWFVLVFVLWFLSWMAEHIEAEQQPSGDKSE